MLNTFFAATAGARISPGFVQELSLFCVVAHLVLLFVFACFLECALVRVVAHPVRGVSKQLLYVRVITHCSAVLLNRGIDTVQRARRRSLDVPSG